MLHKVREEENNLNDSKKLHQELTRFIETDSGNRLPDGGIIYDHFLIGFAAADDSIFKDFSKESVIGSLFRSPRAWLSNASTVISYFLRFSEPVRRSNYDGPLPSVEWLHGRFIGEEFNKKLRLHLAAELENMGGKAVIPALHEDYKADYEHFKSNWSERHLAYAAGLGSFGLSRGLITEKGIAGRFGSAITDLPFPVTTRKAGSPFQNCPFFDDQSCGACIDRCPSGAITAKGKDKSACYRYTRIEDHARSLRLQYGYDHSICGKCQVNVPCEDGIPG